jgi:hypothetical protein
MAKGARKTKNKKEEIPQIEVNPVQTERYMPCEWVIQFDDDEPMIFATANESSDIPEVTIKLQNTNHSHITFRDTNTNKTFRMYARPKNI